MLRRYTNEQKAVEGENRQNSALDLSPRRKFLMALGYGSFSAIAIVSAFRAYSQLVNFRDRFMNLSKKTPEQIVRECEVRLNTELTRYAISDLEGLKRIGRSIGEYNTLVNDIDCMGEELEPIGNNVKYGGFFNGILNGNGYVIRNFRINRRQYGGLFEKIGYIGYASDEEFIPIIANLRIENAYVDGNEYAGLLFGKAINSVFLNCHVEGSVTGDGFNGTLGGYSDNNILVNCSSKSNTTNKLIGFPVDTTIR